MDCSMPGFPVLQYLPEFAQTHVHWVSDAIQPSHPLSPPSPPASIFSSIKVFPNKSSLLIRWPKCWSFSFSISPSNGYSGWFPLGWICLISLLSQYDYFSNIDSSNPIIQYVFLFVSSLISFISVLYFSGYRCFASLGSFISRDFIHFDAMVNGIVIHNFYFYFPFFHDLDNF